MQPLRLFKKAVHFEHFADGIFGPSLFLDYWLDFFPKNTHIIWISSQVEQSLGEALVVRTFINGVDQYPPARYTHHCCGGNGSKIDREDSYHQVVDVSLVWFGPLQKPSDEIVLRTRA